MRLFIAIRFTGQIKEAILETMADLRRQGVSGNFSREENLHLTLAFLGELESPKNVCRAMDRVSAEPFRLKLDACGSFGDIYWVGLEKSPELENYVKRLRAALSEDGIWFDKKKFSPHITIIRRARHMEGIKPLARDESFLAERVSLMKSERVDGRLVYTEIYSVKLGTM